jgi:hypothetical protein
VSSAPSLKKLLVRACILAVAGCWSLIGRGQTYPSPNRANNPASTGSLGWARIVGQSTGRVADLYVDGKQVCRLPCQTLVLVGVHRFVGSGPEGSSAEQSLYVAAGTTVPLVFDIVPVPATLRVAADNADTLIYVDGTYVGKGTWQGAVPQGRHMLLLRRPNGEVLQQYLNAAAGMNYSIRDNVSSPGPAAKPSPPGQVTEGGTGEPRDNTYQGTTGAVFVPIMLGGPSTDTYNSSCPAAEFGGTCTTGGPRGGAIAARLGYSYGWIAPEATLAMSLDISSAGFTFPADTPIPGDVNGLLAQVAAGTKFMRLGIMAGGGARVATLSQGYRYTFSGMLGLVKRHIYVIPDSFFGNKPSYTAPTMFYDAGILIGDSPGIKIYAGIFLWLEFVPDMSLSRDVTTLGLVPEQVPVSLRTITPYSGTQIMFGPLVGVAFGH